MGITASVTKDNISSQNKPLIPSRDTIGYKIFKKKIKQLKEEISDSEFVLVEDEQS